jgi:micrococcal nuclease
MAWGRRGNVIRVRFGGRRKPRWTSANAYSPGLPKKRQRSGWLVFVPLWGGAALLGTAYGAGWLNDIGRTDQVQAAAGLASGERASFSFCHVGAGYNCVVDGDTIWLKGEKIRVADIDAPETHDYRCSSEKELGDRATKRLHDILESGLITLQTIDRDEDSYGRKLRIVLVNGESVGDTLVGEGLARYYGNGRRPWC